MVTHRKVANSAIQLPAVLAIGFTGHRILHGETNARKAIRDLLCAQQAAHQGILYGISSAAMGGDQIFAECCIELQIPLRILLPAPAEQFREDFDEDSWLRTERILKAAISVEVTGSSRNRDERFYDCGIQTVEESQLLVALWNGERSRGVGGTQEMVAFAEQTGHPVAWIHSETGELKHLNASSASASSPPARSHRELEFLNALPDAGVALPAETSREIATAWFDKVDRNANLFAPRARRLASIPIIYTAAAAVLSEAAVHTTAPAAWLAFSAALGIIALVLPAILGLDEKQHLWARTRTAAEVTRSVLALWSTPILYKAIGPEAIPELAGVLRSLNFLKMEDGSRNSLSLDAFKQHYLLKRVTHQIDYFNREAAKAGRQERFYRIAGQAAIWTGGAVAVIATAFFLSQSRFTGPLVALTPEFLALVIAALFQIATMAGALALAKDCARRCRRYTELRLSLEGWQARLSALHTWASVIQVAERIERALMAELLEWRSLIQTGSVGRQ